VSGAAGRRVTVLGPQRRPTLGTVIRTLDLDGPLAVVTAGWQEREPDDGELRAQLGGDWVNLGLYGRWLDVLERDPEFAAAVREHDTVLVELRQLYLVQLDAALTALYAVARRGDVRPRVSAAVLADADAVVRLVDEHHLARVADRRAAFEGAWRPAERPAVAEHIAAVRQITGGSAGLVVSGGHVGVLLHILRLFQVASALPATVVAWSAGAMALTDRVLLFHDRAAQGPAHAEFHDAGLGVVHRSVLLPHARRRLRLDDTTRMAALARRCVPARCVVLDDGVRVDMAGASVPADVRVIAADGHVGRPEDA
jgi:hypothetical protein